MFRLVDSIRFAIERIWQHRVLVLWALVGLTAATTLALSLPLYVDSVDTKLLTSRLSDPPYAFRFRYLGAWNGNIKQPDVTGATNAITNTFTGTIGLPVQLAINYVRGGPWTTRMGKNNAVLGTFSFGTLNGADSKMKMVAGQWPPKAGSVPSGTIPILISQNMLYTKGVGVGDTLTVSQPTGKAIKGQIVAIWAPLNASDPAWIFPPKAFDEALLVQTDDLWTTFQGVDKPVEESDWYVVFNGYGIRTADVSGLLDRISEGQRLVAEALPPIRLDLSPSDKLTAFLSDVTQLTEQLVVMILPVGGLVLYFVTLVAGLLVNRQQNEDVTLSSRGMSRRAILLIHLLMWLILAGIALAVGIAAAPTVVGLVGKTTSFLRFDNTDAPLEITFTPLALMAGAITGLLAASSGLIIAWRTTAQTITSFKQESARGSAAWFQKYYLDFLLLIPAYYELYSLGQRGGLHTTADNPFSDPLTFLGPTLFALGNTLLFLRIWPFLLRIAANIISYGNGISILMALRELTRSMKRYRGALLMMAFTLSLTGYTASMASTIDRTLEDSINYQIGADSVLVTAADTNTTSGAVDANTGQASQSVTGFNTLPAIGLKDIPGVDSVARVGTYPAQIKLAGKVIDGTVMGVDRDTIPAVTRWRQDYSSMPIADLFNRLAPERTGLIVDANTLNTYKLKIGQILDWQVNALNQWYETKAPIVGVVNYFPTLDPRQKFFLITNIDPIWESVGSELPNDIWISLKPGTDPAAVEQAASEKGYPVVQWKDPAVALHTALTAPTRRGVLGFLSIGFVASILLTLVGNIIQSTASFRAQAVQLGALRAMGLGSLAVAIYLIVSQGLAVVGGILGGTAIGAATTLLFLPLLDFGGGLPPYLVRVDWLSILTVYAVFAGVLLSITLFTTFMLGRERLFTVVKLGDAG